MKKTVSIVIALSLAITALGQNPMERPLAAFPTEKATNLMCQDAWKTLQDNPAAAPALVAEALRSGNREYSNAVLGFADETAGPKAIVKTVKKLFPELPDPAKADVLYWIGRNKLTSLQSLIDQSLNPSEAGEAAAFAAVQIGGKHNEALLDKLVRDGSPLAPLILRLYGKAAEDDDDSTRNSLRDQK